MKYCDSHIILLSEVVVWTSVEFMINLSSYLAF